MRVHEVKVATKTITSICTDLGLGPSSQPGAAAAPGSSSSLSGRIPGTASRWT
jgi:hypothetical protein